MFTACTNVSSGRRTVNLPDILVRRYPQPCPTPIGSPLRGSTSTKLRYRPDPTDRRDHAADHAGFEQARADHTYCETAITNMRGSHPQ